MNDNSLDDIRTKLKSAFPPVKQPGLQRDLWPEMLRKLGERPARVPWFDWALLGLLVMWILYFPQAIPVFLYHL